MKPNPIEIGLIFGLVSVIIVAAITLHESPATYTCPKITTRAGPLYTPHALP